jgi:hypothetical protein
VSHLSLRFMVENIIANVMAHYIACTGHIMGSTMTVMGLYVLVHIHVVVAIVNSGIIIHSIIAIAMASVSVSSATPGSAATPAVVDTPCRTCEWEKDCHRCNLNIGRWRKLMFIVFFKTQGSRTFALEHGESVKKRLRMEQLFDEFDELTSDDDGRVVRDVERSDAESQ